MPHTIAIWLASLAFFGAGAFNAIGAQGTRDDFVRWGFPAWWGRVTGGLEIGVAALLAFPAARGLGLILGAVIVAAAVVTVLRHREVSHLLPLGVFALLIGLCAAQI